MNILIDQRVSFLLSSNLEERRYNKWQHRQLPLLAVLTGSITIWPGQLALLLALYAISLGVFSTFLQTQSLPLMVMLRTETPAFAVVMRFRLPVLLDRRVN